MFVACLGLVDQFDCFYVAWLQSFLLKALYYRMSQFALANKEISLLSYKFTAVKV